eukprot:CAMPEP_0117537790 /NCGR_PEP_ID=MMETSP0784-20121206/42150_1 /TAXON_ID=39447 /ORGANISM="" /LENGTH=276 /DNA_ID=CAMNT_0005334395 /DNA_START=83 /DNA_END=913 /DNA_ORIENTATION=+
MGYGAATKGKSARTTPYSKEDQAKMIYVANLPFSAEWQELKDFFGKVGTVEYARVLSFDGNTVMTRGQSRGRGYVMFSTAAEAKKAVSTLNGAEMDGRKIEVDSWTGSAKGSSPAGGKTNATSGATYPWKVPPAGKGTAKGNDDGTMVYVGNLPYSAEWQELKDLFAEVGTVEYTRVLSLDGNTVNTRGRSRGVGYVKFTKPSEAKKAIAMFNGHQMDGRAIVVDQWTASEGPSAGGKSKGKSTGTAKSAVKGTVKGTVKGKGAVKGKGKVVKRTF